MPTLTVGLICAALAVPVALAGPALAISTAPDQQRMLQPIGSLLGAFFGCCCTLAMQPTAPEWEPGPRRRVRAWHAVTWILCTAVIASAPIVASVLRLVGHVAEPASAASVPLVIIGVHAVSVALFGRSAGTVIAITAITTTALVEQFMGVRWPLADADSHPQWAWAIAAVAAGAAGQYWSGGGSPTARQR